MIRPTGMRMEGMWRFWGEGAWGVVVEKTDGKGLGFRWEDNIKIGIQEIV